MAEIAFAVPGEIAAPTGGYEYARRLIAHLPAHGVAVRLIALPGSFPHPDADDLDATAAALGAVGRDMVVLVDGLAYGALPEALVTRVRAPLVALVHHPLALEAGLSPARHAALAASER
ncbi:MAG: glycosyl transferase family 1, partial [Alphaproteobacteria bacterium]|nr:glycosyl transferase family 1 [Alphaproteobacteria bacterium]